MKHLLRPALGAVLLLVVSACASPSGQPWTPPPPGTPAPETPAPTAAPATAAPASAAPTAPVESAAPSAAATEPAGSAQPGGRVIELELDAALQILQGGVKVTDIPVTPGETILFKLHNTAGYVHNFWIGPDQALMTNQTAGLVGVPDWSDGEVRELTWVVPDDITGLKFGCTVPGHYSLMQGTFSLAS